MSKGKAKIETKVQVKEREALEKVVANDLSKADPAKKDEFQRIVAENEVSNASEANEETDIQKLGREDPQEGIQDGGEAALAAKKKKVPKESPWASPKPLDESPSA
jgi:hypothetical protein